jgi:ferric-dicitrate binding protein FerR (iron transport regulator)
MLVRKSEAAVSQSPNAGWSNSNNAPNPPQQRRLPPTPKQRRMGTQIGLGVILLALAVIILLDHFHLIH